MKELVLQVDGIMCYKCVKKIEAALLSRDGVEDVRVSEDFTVVKVKLDENRINALQIGSIIEKIEEKSFKIIN